MLAQLLRFGLLFLVTGAPLESVELVDGTVLPCRVVSMPGSALTLRISDSEFVIPRSLVRAEPPPGDPSPTATEGRPDRIVLEDGALVLGRIVSETADSVTVRRNQRERSIARARVVSIEREAAVTLSSVAAALATEALARLADPDPLVTASARRVLETLGAPARPLLEAELRKPDLPVATAGALRRLLARLPPALPEAAVPSGALRVLFDADAGEALLLSRLGLTDAQRPAVREALAAASRRFGAALPRVSTGDRTEATREIHALVDEFLARMRETLTDVQQGLLEGLLLGPR